LRFWFEPLLSDLEVLTDVVSTLLEILVRELLKGLKIKAEVFQPFLRFWRYQEDGNQWPNRILNVSTLLEILDHQIGTHKGCTWCRTKK